MYIDELQNFYHLFDSGNIVIFKWRNDQDWSVEYVSNNVHNVLGYTKDDFLKSKVLYKDLVHKNDLERVSEEVRVAIYNNIDNFTHEKYRLIKRDGTIMWINDITHIVKDDNGNIEYFLGYITDITKQTNIEKSFLDLSNRFALALDSTKDGLWDWDLITDSVFFSVKWKEMLGYSDDELPNHLDTWKSRVHKDDMPHILDLIQDHLTHKNQYYESEHRVLCKDGSYKWVLDRGKALFDKNGKPYRMIGFHTDISEQKALEAKLIEYNNKLQKAQQVAHMGYWHYTPSTNMLYWSDEIYNIFEINKNLYSASVELFFSYIPDDDRQIVKEAFDGSIAYKSAYKVVHKIVTNNKIKYLQEEAEHKYNDNGEHIESIGSVIDITEQKTTNERLQILNKNLQDEVNKQLNELREKEQLLIQQSKMASMGEMIGAIAHQWRQPLNTLSIIKDVVIDDYYNNNLSDEKMKTFEKRANDLIGYMSKTIDDFRNFFKPSKEMVVFDLAQEIKSIQSIVQAQLKHSSINLTIECEEKHITIKSYPNELKQVLVNIINNSKDAIIKQQDCGDIILKVYTDGEYVCIDISDNGGGIDDTIINKIFEPYFTTKFEAQGTGLGLYMSKTIIENSMHGILSVKNIDTGAMFSIKLKKGV